MRLLGSTRNDIEPRGAFDTLRSDAFAQLARHSSHRQALTRQLEVLLASGVGLQSEPVRADGRRRRKDPHRRLGRAARAHRARGRGHLAKQAM